MTGVIDKTGNSMDQAAAHLDNSRGSFTFEVDSHRLIGGVSGIEADVFERRKERSKGEPILDGIRCGAGQLDTSLLNKAKELLESFQFDDPQDVIVRIEALSGLVSELWRGARASSQYHRQILAALDSAAIQAGQIATLVPSQLNALRSAVYDLSQRTLTQANVDSIAGRLIDEGFSPLAPLGSWSVTDDAGRDSQD